jgi:hypothetical protein
MPQHRWSGWLGAWCLDCGAEDQREICLAGACGTRHTFDADDECWRPPIHENAPCECPGAGHADPYRGQA